METWRDGSGVVLECHARFASASELELHERFALSEHSTSATAGIKAREFDPWRTGFFDGSGVHHGNSDSVDLCEGHLSSFHQMHPPDFSNQIRESTRHFPQDLSTKTWISWPSPAPYDSFVWATASTNPWSSLSCRTPWSPWVLAQTSTSTWRRWDESDDADLPLWWVISCTFMGDSEWNIAIGWDWWDDGWWYPMDGKMRLGNGFPAGWVDVTLYCPACDKTWNTDQSLATNGNVSTYPPKLICWVFWWECCFEWALVFGCVCVCACFDSYGWLMEQCWVCWASEAAHQPWLGWKESSRIGGQYQSIIRGWLYQNIMPMPKWPNNSG